MASRLALVILLAFWIINGLVVSRASADVAERWYRTPSANEFWRAVNQDMAQGVNVHNPHDKGQAALKKQLLKQYGVDKLEDLPVNFAGVALQAGEEHDNQVFDKHYSQLWNLYERQEQVHKLGATLAPLLAIRSLSMALSGTDFAQHRDFAAAAEQYRRRLIKMMNENMAYHSKTLDGFDYVADQKLWEQVPDFQYMAPGLGWVLRRQVLSLSILLLWFAMMGAGAVIAAIKIRV